MKKRVVLLVICVALCLSMAGCGGNGGQPAGKTAEQPVMLEFFGGQSGTYGVINDEGTLVIPLAERDPDSVRILDYDRRQYWALEIETLYPAGEPADNGEYRIAGQNFRFYDPWGKLVHEQRIDLPQIADGNNVEFWLAKDGSLEHSRFLVNTFASDGSYRVLDADGNELVAKQIFAPEDSLRYAFASLEMDDEMMIVNYTCYFKDSAEIEGAEFYTLDGEPIATERGYNACYRGWNVAAQAQTAYYNARYTDEDGRWKYDVLDTHGQVLLSGLEELSYSMGEAMIVSKDGVRGLMNLQGEWLYKE